jgi:hypothetical protein
MPAPVFTRAGSARNDQALAGHCHLRAGREPPRRDLHRVVLQKPVPRAVQALTCGIMHATGPLASQSCRQEGEHHEQSTTHHQVLG